MPIWNHSNRNCKRSPLFFVHLFFVHFSSFERENQIKPKSAQEKVNNEFPEPDRASWKRAPARFQVLTKSARFETHNLPKLEVLEREMEPGHAKVLLQKLKNK